MNCEDGMKASSLIWVSVALLGMAAGITANGQAYAVAGNGKVTQEQAGPAIAAEDQPSKEQLARLFSAMRIQQQVQSMRQMVPSMVQSQIQMAMKQTEAGLPSGTKLTAEQREGMQTVMSKYVGKAMDLYPADEMQADMTAIYQRHLSKQDVDGLIAFYESPAGQHFLDAQPVIAKEYMPVVMGKVAERSQAMTKDMMKEMSAYTPSQKPVPGKSASGTATKPPAQ